VVVNVLIKSIVYVVDLGFNTQQNLLVLCVLLAVPSIEPA
jgi:hypothetical protein